MKLLYLMSALVISVSAYAKCMPLAELYEKELSDMAKKLVFKEVQISSKGEHGFAFDVKSCGKRGCDTLIVAKKKNCFTLIGYFFGQAEILESETDGYKDISTWSTPTAIDEKNIRKTFKYNRSTKIYE